MTRIIRPAVPEDISRIAAIYGDAVANGTASFELTVPGETEMLGRFETLTRQGYPYLVVEQGGQLAGYAYAGPYRPRPAYRWLVENSIYLDASMRGQGHGKALLEALISECANLGFRQMMAVIGDSENAASVGLHKACGFEWTGVMKKVGWKFNRWLDVVLMQLALGEGGETPADENSLPGRMYEIQKTM